MYEWMILSVHYIQLVWIMCTLAVTYININICIKIRDDLCNKYLNEDKVFIIIQLYK